MKYFLFVFLLAFSNLICAQEQDTMAAPYHQIPEYPEDYSSGNILSRMIDGLGYRYYWASVDLNETDLNYKPSEDGKTTLETLEHLHGLSSTILNGTLNIANIRPNPPIELDYNSYRLKTLENLKAASEACANKSAEEIADLKVTFQRGENINEFEFWHMINGPIADALYHTGQLVAFRRASGNPLPAGVSVFMGKTKE